MGTSQSTRIPSRTSLVKSLIADSLLPYGDRASGLRGLDDRLQHGDVGRRLLAADLGPRPVPHTAGELRQLLDDRVHGRERYRGRRGLATAGEEEARAVRLAPGLRLRAVQRDDC